MNNSVSYFDPRPGYPTSMSGGKRINSSADDAAGSAIVNRMTAEIQGLKQSIRNASDAQALLGTAEGAIEEIQVMLLRLRELAVQSSNGTNTTTDRTSIEAEAQSLEAEITRIADNTTWAGLSLLNGDLSGGVGVDWGWKRESFFLGFCPGRSERYAKVVEFPQK